MGDSEIDQIFKIFKVLGTPTDSNWAEALKLPDFKPTFPKWKGVPLTEHTQGLDEVAIDLLQGMVALDPNKRISARMALLHPYFDTLDKSKLPVSISH
jgi:serine/threonine protein kinase